MAKQAKRRDALRRALSFFGKNGVDIPQGDAYTGTIKKEREDHGSDLEQRRFGRGTVRHPPVYLSGAGY
ncbi:hypothetical protein, partial [Dysosmobacter sp.]|uniref:hypothetical protein n=1 Tax=Dysosmobacter sp. TaxID=2591382 RepID=UPI003D900AA0